MTENNPVSVSSFSVDPNAVTALNQMAASNPEIAESVIESYKMALRISGRNHMMAAVSSMVIVAIVLGGFLYLLIHQSVVEGLVYLCGTVLAGSIISSYMTGNTQDVSWIQRIVPKLPKTGQSESAD